MSYVVIELHTNADGQTANLTYAYDDLDQAYSKYHAVLSAAAVSSAPYHAAVLLDRAGIQLAQWCFEHTNQ